MGYCQGTAFIVGLLLMMMPEEEAFSVLVMLMGDARFRMREIFKPSMTELGLCVHQLDSLMEAQLPDLHQHFQSQAVHTNLFASRWFLTLFTSCVSVSLSSRILDSFLCEGREVIFRLALTLLGDAREELLQRDIEGVTRYFQVTRDFLWPLVTSCDFLTLAIFSTRCQRGSRGTRTASSQPPSVSTSTRR